MITIQAERRSHTIAREQLLDTVFGASRFAKSSERLREGRMPADGLAFVALGRSRIVGTASLDGSVVRTVFVAPHVQARGIGKLLMAEIERTARERNTASLTVPSSVTAETFCARLGFTAVRGSYHGDERTIIMERSLDNASP